MARAETERAIRDHVLAGLVAILAATLLTWPLARDAGDHVLHAAYYWDAFTNTMIMSGHVDSLLGRSALSLYDNYFFAPLPDSVVFNENLFGLSLLFAPLYLVSGNPLWAYNYTLLLSLSLSAFFTYLLVKRVTGSGLAGILAGVAFAGSPYVMFEVGRIQLVATQWIPVCFLFLHRTFEERRLRDAVGLGVCYVLQVGTCLYYAMFLVPLLGLMGGVLLLRHGVSRRLLSGLLGVAVATAGALFWMVRPYFAARERFALERSLSFASLFDGELSFFANVYKTNRSLTALHHTSDFRHPYEEIAFPGFVLLVLLALSLAVPVWRAPWRGVGLAAAGWALIAALGLSATLLTHSMLTGALVLGGGVVVGLRAKSLAPFPFAGTRGLYFALLWLAVLLFLGLAPGTWEGEPVRGIYYYLHTYVPGFNGIRKVSRQAVMTTFLGSVLAGFGSAWLFEKLTQLRHRVPTFALLLGATCYELRTAPHPMFGVWAEETVPEAYRFMKTLPKEDVVAVAPQDKGVSRFRREPGLALHNYLMLHHQHRSLNGQSSWQPTATVLANRALNFLPSETSWRVLRSLGASHLLVHADDLEPSKRDLPELLARQSQHYRRVFQRGTDSVFTLVKSSDPTLELLDTPPLPTGAVAIPSGGLSARASHGLERAGAAIDGDPRTYWTPKRYQAPGQYLEIILPTPREVVALEIENPAHQTDVPLSHRVEAWRGSEAHEVVASQPRVRVYRDLVFAPKTFVVRIVFAKPLLADHVRLTLAEPMVGRYLTVHDLRLYASGP